MDNVFTKKVGPLPVWGWAVALVAAYLVYEWWRGRSSASSAPTIAPTSALAGGVPYTGARPTVTTVGKTTPSATPSAETWAQHAMTALANLGYTPNTISKAMQAYFSHSPLDQSSYNIITAAEKLIGNAPYGSPQSPTLATPTPTPAPTSTSGTSGSSTSTSGNTTPATSTASKIAGVFQHAPTGNVFASTGQIYSPISTYQQTLAMLEHGTTVYLKTATTGGAVAISTATEFRKIENTGNHAFTQYTSYTLASNPSGTKSNATA